MSFETWRLVMWIHFATWPWDMSQITFRHISIVKMSSHVMSQILWAQSHVSNFVMSQIFRSQINFYVSSVMSQIVMSQKIWDMTFEIWHDWTFSHLTCLIWDMNSHLRRDFEASLTCDTHTPGYTYLYVYMCVYIHIYMYLYTYIYI